jgi:signal transduction histidine kinase
MPEHANWWFRAAALMMTAALTAPSLAERLAAPSEIGQSAAMAPLLFIVLVLGGAFGWGFWRVTAMRPSQAGRWVHLLLALQTVAAFLLAVDLLPLITAELGYVLPPRQGWRWCGALMILLLAVCLIAVIDGSFEPATGLTHLPFWAQALATTVQISGWGLFAFLTGRLLACERMEREEHAQLNAELHATRELLAQTARSRERLRIARELHDTLGHHLTALAVNLDLAGRLAGPEAKEVIGRAHLLSKLLLSDVRDTVASMRQEPALDLARALQALAANVPDLEVSLTAPSSLQVGPEQAHALLRSTQEALTNAVRHAKAKRVWITLSQQGGMVRLTVLDDGSGTAQLQPGNGLRGMRERLQQLGGTLEFGPVAGRGFQVHAELPGGEPV